MEVTRDRQALLPRVLILYTGGTFGMEPGLSLPELSPELSIDSLRERLQARVPELAQLARCDIEIVLNRDSAHLGPDEWLLLARRIRQNWRRYHGVVILHGTDTLAYSASALSFLLRPCLKPVVMTGAQRPLSALRTDARRNLISAVDIAAHGPRAVVGQVTLFFDDVLLQGNRARKRSASEFAAFESPQAAPLAVVGTSIRYAQTRSAATRAPALKPVFNRKVSMLQVTPGFPAEEIAKGLLPRLDGLVLIVFPSVTAPTHDERFLELLRGARRRGLPVVIVTESASHAGATDRGASPGSYAAGRQLIEEGCLWAGPMTPECAYVKTQLLLGQGGGGSAFARRWKHDYAGET